MTGGVWGKTCDLPYEGQSGGEDSAGRHSSTDRENRRKDQRRQGILKK